MNSKHLIVLCLAISARPQSQPSRPAFDVASIKRNNTACAGGRGGRGGAPAPGRLTVMCMPVRELIQAAYGTFADGVTQNQRILQILNLPDWVDSELYDIEAKPAGNATIPQMYGPMLQTLLEDRFQLRIHRETRQLPVYTLTAGKVKLTASTCTPLDLNHPPPPPQANQPPPAYCGRGSFRTVAGVTSVDILGVTMASFAGTTLSSRVGLDRPVLDRTGLEGMFDVHLKYSARPETSTEPADSAPSLISALQEQLGLKLSPDRGPVEVLVVDRIERPTGN